MVKRTLFGNEAIAMKAKRNLFLRAARHPIGAVVCAGAVLLIASNTQAQNLFVSDFNNGNIYEFTPGGTQSTFASGLSYPAGLAFNSAGNLFVANAINGNITEITPNGTQSIYATFFSPRALAFNNAGNLFVVCAPAFPIHEIMPDGTESDFTTNRIYSYGLAFNSTGDLFVTSEAISTIFEFTPSGVQTTFSNSIPVTTPYALAFDSAGDLFVSDDCRDRYPTTPASQSISKTTSRASCSRSRSPRSSPAPK